jgi:hypothetical protein
LIEDDRVGSARRSQEISLNLGGDCRDEFGIATAQDASFHLEGPMPSGRLILVRHGETIANQQRVFAADDTPLSETGRWQSEQVAQRLAREFKPDVLVSSHFLRSRQTSEIIGRVLGLTPEPISGIHERDLGAPKGLPYERFAEAPDAAETIDSVTRRAMAALEALRECYPAHEIVPRRRNLWVKGESASCLDEEASKLFAG